MAAIDSGLDELLDEHGRRLPTGNGEVHPDTRHQLRQVTTIKQTFKHNAGNHQHNRSQ